MTNLIMRKITYSLILVLLSSNVYADVGRHTVGAFTQKDLMGWSEKSFNDNTQYKIIDNESNSYLQATAQASASALYKKIQIDLNKTPYLNWSWRIDKPLKSTDELTKQGDDYAARVYVIVKRGLAPWKTNALNYVWSSNPMPPESWPNAYTEKAKMIPLRTSEDDSMWKNEKINIKADFKKYFGLELDSIDGVAIMTDADDTQGHAVASYGDIFFTEN